KLNVFLIKKAINILDKLTCLNFVRANFLKNEFSGIIFVANSKCYAYLGKTIEKSWQKIGIGMECHNLGGILRMILRTLGIIYQHCRFDRDTFIKVFPENIAARNLENFQIKPQAKISRLFLPYEYGSVMHFGTLEGSKNRGYTLMPKDHFYENTVGQLDYPTFNDIKALNLHYCSSICKIKIICRNHGYQNPNDCNKCVCIDGFRGVHCDYYTRASVLCKEKLFEAKVKPSFLKITQNKVCFYHLKTNIHKRIKIGILKISMEPKYSTTCSLNRSFEVKYLNDKSVAGARFCHQKFTRIIYSESNHVMFIYRSDNPRSYVYLYYKEIP
ncbi:Astacin-like metalloendopeptidase, partial [Strongyloides ratti]|uniref:Metalloendopeptidase n=1 Tax=Strongyloides ratti TaxID=34506 RepID=A0A090MLP5_STRRB